MTSSIKKQGRFALGLEVDEQNMIGRQWWQEGLKSPSPDRRNLIIALGVGGLFATCGASTCLSAIVGGSDSDVTVQRRNALALQMQHGWSFGVMNESTKLHLGEPGVAQQSAFFAFDTLISDLRPRQQRFQPFYVPTLFESVSKQQQQARPATTPATEDYSASLYRSLDQVIRMVSTPEMKVAHDAGARFGEAVARGAADPAVSSQRAIVVDMAGPQAVAFAAGTAQHLEPIFVFDNWPHPRGVVPSHRTLGAVLHHHSELVQAASARPATAPPIFVLDRARLPPYVDENTQFDNRYLAKLPSAEALRAMNVGAVTYVSDVLPEADDVNDDFLGWHRAGIPVAARLLSALDVDAAWQPTDRRSQFSAAGPRGFGEVPVIVAASGVLLGAQLYRDGSWNRASSYGGG